MIKTIKNHFQNHSERSFGKFVWYIGAESTLASLCAAAVLTLLLKEPEREFLSWSLIETFLYVVILAPVLETLLCQALPILILRLFTDSVPAQIGFSTLLFAALHFPEGIGVGISAGVVGGFYFAFAFTVFCKKSAWQAIAATALCHAIHNGIAFLLIALSGHWS